MTEAEEITHLKAQLAERDEAIRELNERASSHLRASQDTIQALKLELDIANAKLRNAAAGFPVFDSSLLEKRGIKTTDTFHGCIMNADKQDQWKKVLFNKVSSEMPPHDLGKINSSKKHFRLGEGCKWVEMTDEEYKNGDWVTVESGINPLASTQNQS